MYPILFKLGNINLYSYGFFYFVAIAMAFIMFVYRGSKEKYNVDFLINFMIIILISGLVGTRFFYVLMHINQVGIFDIFSAKVGYFFYGGYIVGLLMGILYILINKYSIVKILDIATPLMFLFLFLGRIGCFLKGCCWGTICNLEFICVRFPKGSGAFNSHLKSGDITDLDSFSKPVYPVQIFESIVSGALFIIYWIKYKKRRYDGQITYEVLFTQAVSRLFLDFLRADSTKIYIFTTAQFIALFIIIFLLLIKILNLIPKSKSP